MLEKLQAIEDKYREIEARLGDPEILADVGAFQRLSQEHAQLAPVVEKIRAYKKAALEIKETCLLYTSPSPRDTR